MNSTTVSSAFGLPCSTRKTFRRKRLKIPAKTPCCVCCLSAVCSKLQKFMLLLTPLFQLAMAAWLGSLWSPSVVLYCCYCYCCVCCAVNKKDAHNFHSHFGYPHGLALCCNRIPKVVHSSGAHTKVLTICALSLSLLHFVFMFSLKSTTNMLSSSEFSVECRDDQERCREMWEEQSHKISYQLCVRMGFVCHSSNSYVDFGRCIEERERYERCKFVGLFSLPFLPDALARHYEYMFCPDIHISLVLKARVRLELPENRFLSPLQKGITLQTTWWRPKIY